MEENLVLEGYGVTLQRLTHDKIEMLRQWRNDPKISQYMFYREYITPEMQERWFANLDKKCDYYFIIEYEGKEVGCINIRAIDWQKRTGEPGIFIYDEDAIEAGVATRAGFCFDDWIWKEMKLDYLTIEVRRSNKKAMQMNISNGYEEIPLLPGDPDDKVRMILTRERALAPNKKRDRLRRIFNKH